MTSEPLPDTWARRDLPVLRAAVAGVDKDPDRGIRLSEIVASTHLSIDEVYRAAKALETGHLIQLHENFAPNEHTQVRSVTGVARVRAGQWPSEQSALDRMIAALEAIAAKSQDPAAEPAARAVQAFRDAGKAFEVVSRAALTGDLP